MFRKLPAYISAVLLVVTLASCGGGGGGGGSQQQALTFYAYTSLPDDTFPVGTLTCGASGVGYGFYNTGPLNAPVNHAFAWNPLTGGKQDWNSATYRTSYIYGADDAQQVGYGDRNDDPGRYRGLIWNNSSSDPVEILPTGFDQVLFYSVDNGYEVGLATPPAAPGTPGDPENHPFVFHGTNDTAVDLMPPGFVSGWAVSIAGNSIGGNVDLSGIGDIHACMWKSHDAASFVDLHVSSFTVTNLNGVSTNQQVGVGTTSMKDSQGSFISHALLWKGSAASVVDLNPSDQEGSYAAAVRNGIQVGYHYTTFTPIRRACYWQGTPDSMVDLDQYITDPHGESAAEWIDDQGWIYGQIYPFTSSICSVVWVPDSQSTHAKYTVRRISP